MNPQDELKRFPERICASTKEPDLCYTRLPAYYAVQPWRPSRDDRTPALVFEDEAIAVFKSEDKNAKRLSDSQTLIAVYGLEPGGSFAVPTGRIFVRFAEGVEASSQRRAIEQAGYTLDEVVSYAPNAAWVEARTGDIAQALSDLPRLEKLPQVENVEPQLLMERARRAF